MVSMLKRHIEWGVERGAYFLGMGDYIDFACVELDAEALTPNGFKRHDELMVGEPIAAFDGERIVWSPLLAIHHYESAPVVQFGSKSFNARVTPSHQWVASTLREGRRVTMRSTEALVGKASNLTIVAPAVEGDHSLTSDEAWTLGWLISDGHIRWSGNFSILQSEKKYAEEIKARLGEIIRHDGFNPVNQMHCFDLWPDKARAILWRAGIEEKTLQGLIPLLSCLTRPARQAMLDALLKAEGSFHAGPGRKGNWRFSQSIKNKLVCEVFQILCTLEGLRLGCSKPKSSGVWAPRILSRERPGTYYMTMSYVGERPVWCPETVHGTWVMRQGVQIAITGNSPSNRQALRAAALYDNAQQVIDDAARHLVQEVYEKALKPSKGRWLGLLEGHHFTQFRDGTTSDQMLCQMLNAPFLGTSAYVRLVFNRTKTSKASLLVWCHHGVGGGRRLSGPLNQLETLPAYWDADIFLLGHHTKKVAAPLDYMTPVFSGAGKTGPRLLHRTKILACTGGFMRGYQPGRRDGNVPRGNYVEQKMLNPVALGGVIIKIRPRWLRKYGQDIWLPDLSVEQ